MNNRPHLSPAAQTSVRMSFGSISTAESDTLHRLGERLRTVPSVGETDLRELVIATKPMAAPGGSVALGYSLGVRPASLTTALESIVELSVAERAALDRLKSADLLFQWEDDSLPIADRGMAIPILAFIPLDDAGAEEIRRLVAELLQNHLGGLGARARAVGYYREAMGLGRDLQGKPQLLLYLELKGPDYPTTLQRLLAYPETPFTAWWNPRFGALVGDHIAQGLASTAIRRSAL